MTLFIDTGYINRCDIKICNVNINLNWNLNNSGKIVFNFRQGKMYNNLN